MSATLDPEYLFELRHAAGHLLALAEATPEETFEFRAVPGAQSLREIYLHLGAANLMLLGCAGVANPAGVADTSPAALRDLAAPLTAKQDIIDFLRRSIDAAEAAYQATPPEEYAREVKFFKLDRTVEGIYLRLLAHLNEHKGHLVAYSRVAGIDPPWGKKKA
jgi:uncharacterized damage-inducible protein DinB